MVSILSIFKKRPPVQQPAKVKTSEKEKTESCQAEGRRCRTQSESDLTVLKSMKAPVVNQG